jgi:hypothetical protein
MIISIILAIEVTEDHVYTSAMATGKFLGDQGKTELLMCWAKAALTPLTTTSRQKGKFKNKLTILTFSTDFRYIGYFC